MVKELNLLLADTAKQCGIKKKKRQSKSENQSPWFDRECITLKNKIKQNANGIKKFPENIKLREVLYTLKRRYKKYRQ